MRTETQRITTFDRKVERIERRAKSPQQQDHEAPARQRLSNPVVFLIVATTIAVVGLLYLIQTSQVAGLGYTLSNLENERLEKSLENQQLTYQVAGYEALPRIEPVVRHELGMLPIDSHVFISVPRPASDELQVPPSEAPRHRSLGERIWNRLTGEAQASNTTGSAP